jgi:DNA-binding transcriptional MerR regulator
MPTLLVHNRERVTMNNHEPVAPFSRDFIGAKSELMTPNNTEARAYTIGDLAREFDVTLRTLRFYESKALLKPRREGMARYYSDEDRERLALILQGKRLGFTLTEIRELIASHKGRSGATTLHLTREQCLAQIKLLEKQKREIEAALTELRRNYTSLYTKPGTGTDDITDV